jgi:hypothetical protein
MYGVEDELGQQLDLQFHTVDLQESLLTWSSCGQT